MAKTTPYTIEPNDLSGSPADVLDAVILLQAHGFVVTREPIKRLRATFTVTQADEAGVDNSLLNRRILKTLKEQLIENFFDAAQGSVVVDGDTTTYTAAADIIRPSRFNAISTILK